MIRLLIVEDHAAIAEALGALLGSGADVRVQAICRDKECAETQLLTNPPDVVLCDVMLDGHDRGFELLRAFGSEVAFVMYSAFDFPAYHARALEYGARGYISKMAPVAEIQSAIRRAAAGKTGVLEAGAGQCPVGSSAAHGAGVVRHPPGGRGRHERGDRYPARAACEVR